MANKRKEIEKSLEYARGYVEYLERQLEREIKGGDQRKFEITIDGSEELITTGDIEIAIVKEFCEDEGPGPFNATQKRLKVTATEVFE